MARIPYVVPAKTWGNKNLITAGVDVGSVGSKAVIMIDGEVYAWAVTRPGLTALTVP